MKKYLSFLMLSFLFPFSIDAAVCTDLKVNVSRYQENENVLSLQKFLFEKGHLKANPNGYFGGGTFSAVKEYQKSLGVSQTGTVGPLTRAKIKEESCAVTSTSSQIKTTTATNTTIVKQATTTGSTIKTPEVVVQKVETKEEIRNKKRLADVEAILKALALYYKDSRGVHIVTSGETPVELCIRPPYTMSQATATEVAVLASPTSPCVNYVDVSFLEPTYLGKAPRDPSLATSSLLLGYTILRSEYNDITIAAKTTDNKAIIKARCNFNAGCQQVTKITNEEYGVPSISSLSHTILLKDAYTKTGIKVTGKNFSRKNKIIAQSKTTLRSYDLGTYDSTDGKTLTIGASSTYEAIPCGQGCLEKLPLGDFTVSVSNEGGVSNYAYFTLKPFTTSSTLARGDATVLAKSTNVKIGSVSFSASIPVTLTSLVFKASSTSAALPGKITKMVLKDQISNTTITGGPSFSLGNAVLFENHSKLYDLYIDTGDVLVNQAGHMTYTGTVTVKDVLQKVDFELPVKEIVFSVSP